MPAMSERNQFVYIVEFRTRRVWSPLEGAMFFRKSSATNRIQEEQFKDARRPGRRKYEYRVTTYWDKRPW